VVETKSASTRRIDQWLWFARLFKSRTAAAHYCSAGRMRVNAASIAKASHAIKEGDVLTFVVGGRLRVVRIRGLGTRRGPAAEAAAMYQEIAPAAPDAPAGNKE